MTPNLPDNSQGQPSIGKAALFGLCPRCSEQTLFEGLAQTPLKCSHCQLDFAALDTKTGPSGLLTVLVSVILFAIAMGVESAFAPPIWIHALIWIPVTFAAVMMVLRWARTSLVYDAYADNTGTKT